MGATKPEEYGDYFAWGETTPKKDYSWNTYKWGTKNALTKYTATDGKTVLEPEDDAATANCGGEWRMPTNADIEELVANTTNKWMTLNGVNGREVKPTIDNHQSLTV